MKNDEPEFYRAMVDRYRELAGFAPDEASDIALRFHALAGELDQFSRRIDDYLRQSAPGTAEAGALDSLAMARGLTRRAASAAGGMLQFQRRPEASDPELPEGTACLTADGTVYLTTQSARFAPGAALCTVSARASRPGRAGNALPGTIHTLRIPVPGVAAVTNPTTFSGGTDEEPDEELRRRLLAHYSTPNNGANAAFYRDAAEHFPGVSSAAALPGDAAAEVVVYVAGEGSSSLPDELKNQLRAELETRRELCARLSVADAEVHALDLDIEIEPEPGIPFEEARTCAEEVLRKRIDRMVIGEPLILAQAVRLLLETCKIRNCRILSPAADMAVGAAQVLRAGTIRLTRMEAVSNGTL